MATLETVDAAESPPLPRGDTNGNPPGIDLWALLREDLATHDGYWLEQGFWAVAVHRLGNARMSIRWKLFRAPCTLAYWIMFHLVEWLCGITLPYTTRLGRRVRIWHHGGMILHARSIGHDVHIRQNTTFGVARRDRLRDIPIIEDRAELGCGVCVLGRVRVGHDSVVGANAVVLRDVPPHSVAAGVPARVVKSRPAGPPSDVVDAAFDL